jgi:hypothetical protein
MNSQVTEDFLACFRALRDTAFDASTRYGAPPAHSPDGARVVRGRGVLS